MAFSIRMEGLQDLNKRLHDLPGKVNRKIVRGALLRGIKPLESRILGNLEWLLATRGSDSWRRPKGREPGDLMRSIGHRIVTYRNGLTAAWVGPSWPMGAHGVFLEYGTVKQDAKPFMRPAWDLMISRVESEINARVKELMMKEA